jgi:hypothetical protein
LHTLHHKPLPLIPHRTTHIPHFPTRVLFSVSSPSHTHSLPASSRRTRDPREGHSRYPTLRLNNVVAVRLMKYPAAGDRCADVHRPHARHARRGRHSPLLPLRDDDPPRLDSAYVSGLLRWMWGGIANPNPQYHRSDGEYHVPQLKSWRRSQHYLLLRLPRLPLAFESYRALLATDHHHRILTLQYRFFAPDLIPGTRATRAAVVS